MELVRAHTHVWKCKYNMSVEKCVQFASPTPIEMQCTSPWTRRRQFFSFPFGIVSHSFVFTNIIHTYICATETQRECMYLFILNKIYVHLEKEKKKKRERERVHHMGERLLLLLLMICHSIGITPSHSFIANIYFSLW